MSRKRKPVTKPVADALEAVVWRARNLVERLEYDSLNRPMDAIRYMKDALDDLEASKCCVGVQGQLELMS